MFRIQNFKCLKSIISRYIMLFILWLSKNYFNIRLIIITINFLLLGDVTMVPEFEGVYVVDPSSAYVHAMETGDTSSQATDITQGIPSKDDLESFREQVTNNSEKHDEAQPFTEAADLELEKRLKDLQSTETQDISQDIPSVDDLESFKNQLKDTCEEQADSAQQDVDALLQKEREQDREEECINPEDIENISRMPTDTDCNNLPAACNDSAVVENLDSSKFSEIYDKFFNLVVDLLAYLGHHFSRELFSNMLAVLVGTFIVNYFKKKKYN